MSIQWEAQLNNMQFHMLEAAKRAIFSEASRLFSETVTSREEIVASMSDLMDQLDAFAAAFVNKSGVTD